MNYQLIKNTEWKEVEINGEKKQIPDTWCVKKISNVSKIIPGVSPDTTFLNNDIGIDFHQGCTFFGEKYINSSEKKILKEKAKKVAPSNSILISVRAPVGDTNITKNEIAIGRGIAALIPNINKNYLLNTLRLNKDNIAKLGNGSTFEGMKISEFSNFEFPLAEEQENIAFILSKQESIISNIQDLIKKNEIIFNELSEQLLSGVLLLKENNGKISIYKNPENNWKEVEVNGTIKNIPNDWNFGSLKDLADIKGGISAPKIFKITVDNNVVPFFRVSNLSCREKYLSKENTKEFLLKSEYKTIPKNSILIAKSGESIRQKYRSILQENSVIVGHIAALIPKKNVDFLYYEINYAAPEDYLLKDSTMPSLSTVELGNFQIYYPQDMEQEMIVSVLKNQENIIKKQKELLNKEKEKFDWLLDNLLSGNYLVKEMEK